MATTDDDRVEEERLHQLDWQAIERSDEFQELVRSRRRFVVPATIFFLSWYLGFILLCGYAEDFMAESVYEGLTVGYVLALTQFVMVAVLGLMYLKRAEKTYDPLADAVARSVGEHADDREARYQAAHPATPAGEAPR